MVQGIIIVFDVKSVKAPPFLLQKSVCLLNRHSSSRVYVVIMTGEVLDARCGGTEQEPEHGKINDNVLLLLRFPIFVLLYVSSVFFYTDVSVSRASSKSKLDTEHVTENRVLPLTLVIFFPYIKINQGKISASFPARV